MERAVELEWSLGRELQWMKTELRIGGWAVGESERQKVALTMMMDGIELLQKKTPGGGCSSEQGSAQRNGRVGSVISHFSEAGLLVVTWPWI